MRTAVPVVLIAFAVAVVLTKAAPQADNGFDYNAFVATSTYRPFIPVLSRNEIRDENGQIDLNYKSGDGTILNQRAVLKPSLDGKRTVLVQQGTYSYVSPDGTPVQVSYIADETGFHPVGNHILTGDSPAGLGTAPAPPPTPAPVAPPPPPPPAPRTQINPGSYVSHPGNSQPRPVNSRHVPQDVHSMYPFTKQAVSPVADSSLPEGFFRVF